MSQYNIYSMPILLPVPQSVPKHLRTCIERRQDTLTVDLTDARHRHTSELPSKVPRSALPFSPPPQPSFQHGHPCYCLGKQINCPHLGLSSPIIGTLN